MRILLFLLSFSLFGLDSKANNQYRTYLLTRIYGASISAKQIDSKVAFQSPESEAGIPRYQIPKGNIFCRMEDKLTKATKVWIKVGVQ